MKYIEEQLKNIVSKQWVKKEPNYDCLVSDLIRFWESVHKAGASSNSLSFNQKLLVLELITIIAQENPEEATRATEIYKELGLFNEVQSV